MLRLWSAKFFDKNNAIKASDLVHVMRLKQPTGFLLLFWPCAWGVLLASGTQTDLVLLLLMFIGSMLMRSCGCVINDLWDRDFDGRVQRTKQRPIACGKVNSKQAFLLIFILLACSLIIWWMLPYKSQIIALIGGLLMVVYPLAKRYIALPQLFLGITFNVGILIGFFGAGGSGAAVWYLYAAGILWTVYYDTVYAYQDVKDDQKIGIKSAAILFGDRGRAILIQLTKFVMVLLVVTGLVKNYNLGYFVGLAFAAWHLWWQLQQLDLTSSKSCALVFRSNTTFGMLVAIAIINANFWS